MPSKFTSVDFLSDKEKCLSDRRLLMNILELDPTPFVAQTSQYEQRGELTDEDLRKIYCSRPKEWVIEALYTLYKRYTHSRAAVAPIKMRNVVIDADV